MLNSTFGFCCRRNHADQNGVWCTTSKLARETQLYYTTNEINDDRTVQSPLRKLYTWNKSKAANLTSLGDITTTISRPSNIALMNSEVKSHEFCTSICEHKCYHFKRASRASKKRGAISGLGVLIAHFTPGRPISTVISINMGILRGSFTEK